MSQSLLKFYGGRSDANFDDIKNGQIDAFDDLMIQLQDLGKNFKKQRLTLISMAKFLRTPQQ